MEEESTVTREGVLLYLVWGFRGEEAGWGAHGGLGGRLGGGGAKYFCSGPKFPLRLI